MAQLVRDTPVRPPQSAVCLVSSNTILLHFLGSGAFDGVISALIQLDVLRSNAEQLTRIGRDHALVFDEPAFVRGHGALAAAHVEGPLVLLADTPSRPLVRHFFLTGGSAVVPTSAPQPVFTNALRLALAGDVYAPPELWYQGLLRTGALSEEGGLLTDAVTLTERETDVLAELGEGKNNKLIAHALGIAEPTVKMHLSSIARKLGASNRTQILARAMAMGLLTAG